jgi:hypothetical protein
MANDRKWRLVRMPEVLAQRLEVLAHAAAKAYSEGRRDLPAAMVDRVPMWFVVANALDEQEARRERSRRPRRSVPVARVKVPGMKDPLS